MNGHEQHTSRTMNSFYIKSYYDRHPEKRKENRLKDAIRLVQKHGYIVLPPSSNIGQSKEYSAALKVVII